MPIQAAYYYLAASWLETEASYRLNPFYSGACRLAAKVLRAEADRLVAGYAP